MQINILKKVWLFSFLLLFWVPTVSADTAFEDVYLNSSVVEREAPFNTVMIETPHAIRELEVRFNGSAKWEKHEVHDDGFGSQAILFSSPTRLVEFRIPDVSEDDVYAKAHFYLAEDRSEPESAELYSGPEVAARSLSIISRKRWGADENLRYWTPEVGDHSSGSSSGPRVDPCADFAEKYKSETQISRVVRTDPNGEQLLWPLAYSKKVRKLVVHHTDSDLRDLNGDRRMDGRDYKAMVQAIYYFHAVTRGWGDIGYNYIIDPLGNVYEGRYGGDKVVGAHAQCYNNGSLGVAIIGNYEDNQIPEPALRSLILLLAKKSKTHRLDPDADSVFRGKRLPNIIAHKDVRPTSCPGKRLYSMLPRIRELVDLSMRSGSFSENTLNESVLDYNAQLMSSVPTLTLSPNQQKTITLRFKNTGKQTWDQNTWLHVALNNKPHARVVPVIEDKGFVAADMRESTVRPGQTASFDVTLESKYLSTDVEFQLSVVANGRFKISRASVFVPISVKAPRFDYQVVRKELPSGTVFQGQQLVGTLKLKNTGNVKWVNYGPNAIRIGTEALRDRRSKLAKIKPNRLASMLESEVKPGEVGTFFFDLEVPSNANGKIKERFTPVIEGVRWLEDQGLGFEVRARKPRHAARVVNKTVVPRLLPGEMKKIEINLKNNGDLAWDPETMKISMTARGLNLFKKRMVPSDSVRPRQTEDFSFWVQAPYNPGKHQVFLRSKFDNRTIRGGTVRYLIDVPKPRLNARMVKQSSRSVTVRPGEEKELEVQFKNTGNTVWRNDGPNPIHLAPSNPQDRISGLYSSKHWVNKYRLATMVEKEVRPGEIGTFRFTIKPKKRGFSREHFQLVIERVGWIKGVTVRWDVRTVGSKVRTSSSRATRTTVRRSTSTPTTRSVTASTPEPAPVVIQEPEPISGEQPFRVRLSYGDMVSQMTADKSFYVKDGDGNTLFTVPAGGTVEFRKAGNQITTQFGSKSRKTPVARLVPSAAGVVEILSMERRPSWNTNLNDNRFRGTVEVRLVGTEVAYINELPLEDYLLGLAEVSNNSPTEKKKVIAILARTYAQFYMDSKNRKFPGKPYDGSDDPDVFQRYLGYGFELRSPSFKSAVKATEGQVVTYNGKLVKTPYFNQSNGRTLSALETWGWRHTPYLQSVADPHCEGLVQRGHGVGLSGCGATGMAEAGKGYVEIIKYYYTGVEVERLD